MSFSSDCEDNMEDASVLSTTLSPPPSCRTTYRKQGSTCTTFSLGSTGFSCETPKSCRLFDDEDDRSDKPSPYGRITLKPLNLNDYDDSVGGQGDCERNKGRKRSSDSRHAYKRQDQSNSMDNSGSDDSDVTMYSSPRFSPNSYITMDGRYVQSKNPFSSPMMDDAPSATNRHNLHHMSSTKAAPSLPVSFFSSSAADGKMSSLLPPRHQRPAVSRHLTTPATSSLDEMDTTKSLNGGYPDKRFGFTGSPIMEAAYDAAAMEIGLPSAGSLRKVRKLNLLDDVVSATSHDLSYRNKPEDQTSAWMLEEQGVSPTDVTGFPSQPKYTAPPPTPVKAKPHHNPYNNNHRLASYTPIPPTLERRRPATARTPYPGHHIPGNGDDESNATHDNIGIPKSRFYTDFDVIGELGEGSFGKVYKVLSRFDGCMYAIKAAHRRAKGISDRDRMLKEVSDDF